MKNKLSGRYRDFISKISKSRGWGELNIHYGANYITIDFDKLPMVEKLIEEDKLNPRKDYIYISPDKIISIDCKNIYGLLQIQMINVIENYLFDNNKELHQELCKNEFKVYFIISEHNTSILYTYGFHKLKIDDEK